MKKQQTSSNNAATSDVLKTIDQGIKAQFPSLELHFIERDKANQYYSVVLNFEAMKYLDDLRLVLAGDVSVSGNNPGKGFVEYNFKTKIFYRVNFYGKATIRRIFPLMIDYDYLETFEDFLNYMRDNHCSKTMNQIKQTMALLKEDGSLDIERINKLPLEEYMDEIGALTEEQYKEYLSKLPINESNVPTRAVVVDYTLKEELERGSVIADDFINKMREKYEKKQ